MAGAAVVDVAISVPTKARGRRARGIGLRVALSRGKTRSYPDMQKNSSRTMRSFRDERRDRTTTPFADHFVARGIPSPLCLYLFTTQSGGSLPTPSGLKASQQSSRSQPKTRTIWVGVVLVGSVVAVARLWRLVLMVVVARLWRFVLMVVVAHLWRLVVVVVVARL